jgi:uncharacterized protein
MYVASLWRYPVKTLAGEQRDSVEISADGMFGDRTVHVRGPEGVRTSRRHHRLIGLHGSLDDNRNPQVNGHDWRSSEALTLVRSAAGADADLAFYAGVERFDVLPLLVATDGAIAEFGRDVRRLRPNIVIGGVEGMAETTWEGLDLLIGDVRLRLDSLRARCPMTTVDPDTTERDPEVLRDIARRFRGRLCLNTDVITPGRISVGDAVQLINPKEEP